MNNIFNLNMFGDKKRKSLNYSYIPQSLKLNNGDEVVIQPNKINAFETIANTHEFNRTMLKQAYKKNNSIVGIGNKAWIAGTHNIRDVYDDIVHIPNWNKDQQFSKTAGEIASGFTGVVTTGLVSEFTENPEIGLSIGGYVAKKTNDIVMDITKHVGNSKEIQRYKQLDAFMQNYPKTD